GPLRAVEGLGGGRVPAEPRVSGAGAPAAGLSPGEHGRRFHLAATARQPALVHSADLPPGPVPDSDRPHADARPGPPRPVGPLLWDDCRPDPGAVPCGRFVPGRRHLYQGVSGLPAAGAGAAPRPALPGRLRRGTVPGPGADPGAGPGAGPDMDLLPGVGR